MGRIATMHEQSYTVACFYAIAFFWCAEVGNSERTRDKVERNFTDGVRANSGYVHGRAANPDVSRPLDLIWPRSCLHRDSPGLLESHTARDHSRSRAARQRHLLGRLARLQRPRRCGLWQAPARRSRCQRIRPGRTHINGIEGFWGLAKSRFTRFRGTNKQTFYLHLKECEFRFNYRHEDLYSILLRLCRKNPLY